MGCCGTKEQPKIVALTPDERLAMRAALPEHLRLGVSLAGMRELLKQLEENTGGRCERRGEY